MMDTTKRLSMMHTDVPGQAMGLLTRCLVWHDSFFLSRTSATFCKSFATLSMCLLKQHLRASASSNTYKTKLVFKYHPLHRARDKQLLTSVSLSITYWYFTTCCYFVTSMLLSGVCSVSAMCFCYACSKCCVPWMAIIVFFRVSDVVLCMQQVLRTMDGNYQHSMHSLPFLVLVHVVVHNTDLFITVMLYYMYSTSAVSLGVCRTCWLKCLHMTKKMHTHMACWHFSIISIYTPLIQNAIPCTLHRYTYWSGHDMKVMPWTTTHRKLTLTTHRPRDYIACLTVSKDSFPARQTMCMYVWMR